MLLESVLSFLGGSAIRVGFGELINWIKAREERKREAELMSLQGKLEADRHERQKEMIAIEHNLGVQVIRVKAESDLEALNDATWGRGVEQAMKPTGIRLIDTWNGSIRPAAATFALYLWVRSVHVAHYSLQGRDWEMIFAILGFFFADRQLSKRGR